MTINPSTLTILVTAFLSVVLMKYAKAQRFSGTVKNVKWRTKQRDQRPADFVENPAATYMENSFRGMWVLYNEEPYRASFNWESDKKNPKTFLRTAAVVKTLYKLIPLFWTALYLVRITDFKGGGDFHLWPKKR